VFKDKKCKKLSKCLSEIIGDGIFAVVIKFEPFSSKDCKENDNGKFDKFMTVGGRLRLAITDLLFSLIGSPLSCCQKYIGSIWLLES
jgi:hypothetical protein